MRCEVDAPDEQAAIKRAAEVFDIPPERQDRISVRVVARRIAPRTPVLENAGNSIQRYIPGAFLRDIISVDGVRRREPMHPDEYRRLHASCLRMAQQSNSPDERGRWLALAKDCENLLGDSSSERRSKSLSTRLTTRAAANLGAA